ncbi:MAG: ATP-binding cassette domain-containing protein [candidate division Zixibacteria bacterium]|nr:ATP-binding cassette domain-containing protein [Gammaproteobacteria bacterium]NIX55908.1 ATP-binding cassette domain-containing protein [candidate division Zixibacteria bacterium]
MSFDIKFNNVAFTYEGANQPALKDINLTVSPGEIILITGPAGSGKTTLCSCINGLIPHFHEGELRGDVFIRKYNTRNSRVGGLASLVGMVFQDPESQLVTNSVADEIAFGPENFGVPRDEINKRLDEALKATRLEGYDEREPHSLSGGEQQACVIASVFAMQPEIYVLDEPLANLDPEGKAQVMRVVVDLAKQRGKTLILVEHALEEVLPLVDRLIVMDQGQIVKDGPVEEILQAGDIPYVFTRPSIIRLGEKYGISPLPFSSQDFYSKFSSQYQLGKLKWIETGNNHSTSAEPIIILENIRYSYNKSDDTQREALRDVSLSIAPSEMVAIMGRNGSGKTTLIRHIIGLIQPDEGKVAVLGKDVASTPTHELARHVGFCFQNPNHQIVSFNVRDEIIFGLKAHGIDPSEFEGRIRKSLEFVNMLDHIDSEVFDLGKGQKQRLALASVLSLEPEILIVDEPTTGQDPRMAQEIFEILQRLNESGTTIIIITHQIDYAAAFARRAVVLREGKIRFDGRMRELLSDKELMTSSSLEMPETTRLASLMSAHGIPPWLVTTEELELAIEKLLESSNGN